MVKKKKKTYSLVYIKSGQFYLKLNRKKTWMLEHGVVLYFSLLWLKLVLQQQEKNM